MGWTTPRTWVDTELETAAIFNPHVRDNLGYLLNRPGQTIIRNNAAAYTTTSTTFVDIDTTNLAITLVCAGAAVQVSLALAASANLPAMLDFVIDGVRYGVGFANGLGSIFNSAGAIGSLLSFSVRAVVTPGTRVFKPQWRVASGTGGIQSDPTTTPLVFSAQECA